MTHEQALAGPRQLKERGTPEWCFQTATYLKDCIRHVSEQWRQAEQVLTELTKARAWEVIPPGDPYGTLDELLRAEIGMPEAEINVLIMKAKLPEHGGDRRSAQFQGDNIPLKPERGTSRVHAVRKLRRDHHDTLADQVEEGKMTAAAALRAAGYKRPRTLTVRPDDPQSTARSLQRHMTPENLAELGRLLTGP